MSEYNNVPKIRFKGFTDVWEQRKLGEIGNTFTGLSGKTKEDFGHGEAKFVTYMNVFSNPIAQFNKTEPIEIDNKQNQVEYGDVFFTTSSETPDEVGMSSVWLENKGNIYLNSFCFGFRPFVKNDPYYMAYMLRSKNFRKNMTLLAQGISRYNISKNGVMNIDIQLPINQEQEKIGKLFYEIDNLITLHQRKCDTLVNVKKSLLEKMFPKNSSNIPEIRFKGFTDVWEQRKLSELCNIYDGTHQTPNYKDSGIMFLSVENIKDLSSNKYISYEDFKKNFKVYPEKNDILMTRIGDIGTTNIVKENSLKAYYVSLALLKCRSINPYYLNFAIKSDYVQNGLKLRSLLTAIPMKINKDQIGKVDINYPIDPEEQSNIGKLFDNLDNLITLHQRKLEKLNNIKKSMLDKMFV